MKKILTFFMILFVVGFSFGESKNSKTLYQGGVYGQSFELVEFSDGDNCRLLLFMSDNKTKQTKTYDQSMPTVYSIWSKQFSSPRVYSNAIEASKNFFNTTMNYVYLADMKDICDLAPCCKSLNYKTIDLKNGKNIFIEYECSDLDLLFEIANAYNAKGRDYVMQKYLK